MLLIGVYSLLAIIFIFLIGCLLGYLIKSRSKVLRAMKGLQDLFMAILLILLGYSVGNDPLVLSGIYTLGFEALILTAGAVTGSILFTIPFGKLINKPE